MKNLVIFLSIALTFSHAIFRDNGGYKYSDIGKNSFWNLMLDNNTEHSLKNAFKSQNTASSSMGKDLKYTIMNDKDIFRKQNFILDIMRNIYNEPAEDFNRNFHLVEGESNYKKYEPVIPFFKMHKTNMLLPRGQTFSISNPNQLDQAIALFNLFYYSKDFDVFQQNVLWARYNINEDMFIYCLSVAIIHRTDLLGIKIPSFFEIFPQKFHTQSTLDEAVKERIKNSDDKVVIVKNHYTSDLLALNQESQLAYFTEDISWNQFHFILHIGYPYWLGGDDFGLNRQKRGERYLYLIQQMLARYFMERLSHGMGEIDDISFEMPVKTGYNSLLAHYNGQVLSDRKNYYDVLKTGSHFLVDKIVALEARIRDAIDEASVIGNFSQKVYLDSPAGIDILGNVIQSTKDSVNHRFYGNLVQLMLTSFGGGYVNANYNSFHPSTMDYYETAFRDPATYQVYKRILTLFYQYKNYLPPYTIEDLQLKTVRIVDIKTSKFTTFFDDFDVDVSNIVNKNLQFTNKSEEKLTLARHTRLNHKPFTVEIVVDSDVTQNVIVRLFLGPKFDQYGNSFNINVNRQYFLELDKFLYTLPIGRTNIQRDSLSFKYNVRDRTTYMDLYKKILYNQNLAMLLKLNIDESHCGFPDRILLPKGWTAGMPMQLFVIITSATNYGKAPSFLTKCGFNSSMFRLDNYNLGFPFDRQIDESQFDTANMMFKDILIYHEGKDISTMTKWFKIS